MDFNWTSGRRCAYCHSPRRWIRRYTANRNPKNHRGNSSVKCYLAGIELAFLVKLSFRLAKQVTRVLLYKLTILLYTAKWNLIGTWQMKTHDTSTNREGFGRWQRGPQFCFKWRSGKMQFPSWRNSTDHWNVSVIVSEIKSRNYRHFRTVFSLCFQTTALNVTSHNLQSIYPYSTVLQLTSSKAITCALIASYLRLLSRT